MDILVPDVPDWCLARSRAPAGAAPHEADLVLDPSAVRSLGAAAQVEGLARARRRRRGCRRVSARRPRTRSPTPRPITPTCGARASGSRPRGRAGTRCATTRSLPPAPYRASATSTASRRPARRSGSIRGNTVVYGDADDLLAQVAALDDDGYTRLQAGALEWARASTTVAARARVPGAPAGWRRRDARRRARGGAWSPTRSTPGRGRRQGDPRRRAAGIGSRHRACRSGAVSAPLLVRHLSVEDFGLFVLVTSIVFVVTGLTEGGLAQRGGAPYAIGAAGGTAAPDRQRCWACASC